MLLSKVELIRPVQQQRAFDDPDWFFEIKHDGFRAALYLEGGEARLVSRNDHQFQRFSKLRRWFEKHLKLDDAVIDGEIACLDDSGRSVFADLMTGSSPPYFYAFDLVWLDGNDLRQSPLHERKKHLRSLVPEGASLFLYVDHLEARGVNFFDQACRMDLEGIVAKHRESTYDPQAKWIKVKNSSYSQLEGRSELFNRQRNGGRKS